MSVLSAVQQAALSAGFKAAFGDDFQAALATGLYRCESLDWTPDEGHEGANLAAVALASEVLGGRAADNHPDVDKLLARSFVVLAKRDGYDPQKPPASSGAQSNLLVILGAIVIVVEAAVIAYVVYRATMLVANVLAQHEASQEMMRSHSDAMQVISDHHDAETKAGHVIPYDAGELAVLQSLQQAQDNALKIAIAGQQNAGGGGPPSPTDVGIGVVIGLGAAAALLYFALAPKR